MKVIKNRPTTVPKDNINLHTFPRLHTQKVNSQGQTECVIKLPVITSPVLAVEEILANMRTIIQLIPRENLHNDNAATPLTKKIEATLTKIADGGPGDLFLLDRLFPPGI